MSQHINVLINALVELKAVSQDQGPEGNTLTLATLKATHAYICWNQHYHRSYSVDQLDQMEIDRGIRESERNLIRVAGLDKELYWCGHIFLLIALNSNKDLDTDRKIVGTSFENIESEFVFKPESDV